MATGSSQPSPFAAPPAPPNIPPFVSPPITVILTLVILIFFFAGFFSIYFCKCFLQNLINAWYLRHHPGGLAQGEAAKPAPGLDLHIVQSYPTFSYSSVKGYRREKYGLECAICLIEFEDVDVLRLLTPCCHVFHQECIDLWLESHKTCPVCRRDLELENDDDTPVKSNLHDIQEDEEENKDSVSITIREDNNQDNLDEKMRKGKFVDEKSDGEENMVDKFSRSHSTGHDSVVIGNSSSGKEDEDRYRLRLPDHVKSNIIKSHHNATRSCTTFGEYKKSKGKDRNVIQGEVKSKGKEENIVHDDVKGKGKEGNVVQGEVSGLPAGDVDKV